MVQVLVAFASSEGQTRKISERIASRLRDRGAGVQLVDVMKNDDPALEPFNAALLAGSLHVGHHQEELVRFVKSHREALCGVPTGFVSVSLSAHGTLNEDVAAAHGCVADFFEMAGWKADCTHLAAGAVRDTRLGFLKRWILHRILRTKGVEMPASGVLEFTDWKAVDAFVDQFLKEEIAPRGVRSA
ncbi:protoporphyrinogen oxidase [Rhizobiales bacterium]|uniref:flavodoxin domain-containing protein n=1 Tax=Hongsoonwoonella zoysiae TaxID=2821844 RepID=UPI00155F617A|nr:flavodoxin domain-containing protein [Hongsoonwoonella zoysiae]NRG19753.1 protoporphyrinogen oxidase [Hongsoonwoonella zoysiae]